MFALPTIVLFVILGLLAIAVIALFIMVSRLRKKVNGLAMTLLDVQEQAARGGVEMDSGFRRPNVPAREAAPLRDGGRASVQDKRGGRAVVQPSASPTMRPAVGGGKPGRVVQGSGAAPTPRGQVSGAGMRPMAPAGGTEPDPYSAEEYYTRDRSSVQQASKKGRGKPVIPFGEGRAARDAAYNKYANEAVEQDIAPDSIDLSKVAGQLNINRGKGNLGVYDASNPRRITGNANRRR